MRSTSCNESMIQLIFIMEDDGYTVNLRTKRLSLPSNLSHSALILIGHTEYGVKSESRRLFSIQGMSWTGLMN